MKMKTHNELIIILMNPKCICPYDLAWLIDLHLHLHTAIFKIEFFYLFSLFELNRIYFISKTTRLFHLLTMFGACKDAEGEKKIACKYQKRHERTNVFGVYPEQKSNSKQSVNII